MTAHSSLPLHSSSLTAVLTRSSQQVRGLSKRLPPSSFVLAASFAFQGGIAVSKYLFATLGPLGTVFLKTGFGALLLLALWRPDLRRHSVRDFWPVVWLGLAIAGMNLAFYGAIERIPLGIASTLEFIGPLGIAVVASRRWLDGVWVALAVTGVMLLAPVSGAELDPLGVGLALVAAACWGAYVLLSGPTGRIFPGRAGLALAMAVASLVLCPVGVVQGGAALLQPGVLGLGLAIALLGNVLPYSLEFKALKSLPPRVFGVLISIEPAIAALVGFLLLGEQLSVRALTAVGLVTVAAVGVTVFGSKGR
jgi:inner membrane transporter RhtA